MTTGVGGMRGYGGGKQVKGRKRHVLVATEGLVLTVTVHPADIMDRDGVKLLLPSETIRTLFPWLQHVWLDAGYNGRGKGKDWIRVPWAGTPRSSNTARATRRSGSSRTCPTTRSTGPRSCLL